MSGYSNVGNSGVYEAGDQRNYKQSELNKPTPYEEGKQNSHNVTDSKDQRSIANRLAAAERQSGDHEDSEQTKQLKKDPTLPVSIIL